MDLTTKYQERAKKNRQLNPNLDFLINEFERFRLLALQGSTRSGKTYSALQFLIWLFYEYKGLTISVVRLGRPALESSVFRDFEEIMQNLCKWDENKCNRTKLEYRDNGGLFEFFSIDNDQKVRGRKRHILYCNESNEIPEKEFKQLLFRTEAFAIIDYNPSMVESYIYDKVLTRDDCAHIITTYKNNPHLTKNIIKEIELLKVTDPEMWKIYGEGQRGNGYAGLVFPKWIKTNVFPSNLPFWYGVDFGFTNDPCAIVRQCYDRETQRIYHYEVAYERGLFNSDIARLIKQDIETKRTTIFDVDEGECYIEDRIIRFNDKSCTLQEYKENKSILANVIPKELQGEAERVLDKLVKWHIPVYCDAAEPKSIAELNQHNVSALKCLGKDSVRNRVVFMHQFENCYIGDNIHSERLKYKWKESKEEGRFKNEPIDANNHAMDAATYGAYTHLTKNGYKK